MLHLPNNPASLQTHSSACKVQLRNVSQYNSARSYYRCHDFQRKGHAIILSCVPHPFHGGCCLTLNIYLQCGIWETALLVPCTQSSKLQQYLWHCCMGIVAHMIATSVRGKEIVVWLHYTPENSSCKFPVPLLCCKHAPLLNTLSLSNGFPRVSDYLWPTVKLEKKNRGSTLPRSTHKVSTTHTRHYSQ